jgi:hypothetical protein
MRTITNEELKAAVRKAKEEKRLARMYGRRYSLRATLRNGKCVVCAIGAALTADELAQAVAVKANSPWALKQRGIVEFEDPYFAQVLIRAHDEYDDIRKLNALTAA